MMFKKTPFLLCKILTLSTAITSVLAIEAEIKMEPPRHFTRQVHMPRRAHVMGLTDVKKHLHEINYNQDGSRIGDKNCLASAVSCYNWLKNQTVSPEKVGNDCPASSNMEIYPEGYAVLTAPTDLQKGHAAFIIDKHTISFINESKPHFVKIDKSQLLDELEKIPLIKYMNTEDRYETGILYLERIDKPGKGHFLEFYIYQFQGCGKNICLLDASNKIAVSAKKYLKDYSKFYNNSLYIWNDSARNQQLETDNHVHIWEETFAQAKEETVTSNSNVLDPLSTFNGPTVGGENPNIRKRPQNANDHTEQPPAKRLRIEAEGGEEMLIENSWGLPVSDTHLSFDELQALYQKALELKDEQARRELIVRLTHQLYLDLEDFFKAVNLINVEAIETLKDEECVILVKYLRDNKQILSQGLQQRLFSFIKIQAEKSGLALLTLGSCHEIGIGTEQNLKEAFNCYKKVAEKGDAQGLVFLGNCYRCGIGTEKNPKEAFDCYQKAAEQGLTIGLIQLGNCYRFGIGTEKNPKEAFNCYQKVAEKGDVLGLMHLGHCYRCGIGTEKNPEEIFNCYKKAVEKGSATGLVNLGYCYQHGIGTEKNSKEALNCYKKAAEKGNKLGKEAFKVLQNQTNLAQGSRNDAVTSTASTVSRQPEMLQPRVINPQLLRSQIVNQGNVFPVSPQESLIGGQTHSVAPSQNTQAPQLLDIQAKTLKLTEQLTNNLTGQKQQIEQLSQENNQLRQQMQQLSQENNQLKLLMDGFSQRLSALEQRGTLIGGNPPSTMPGFNYTRNEEKKG